MSDYSPSAALLEAQQRLQHLRERDGVSSRVSATAVAPDSTPYEGGAETPAPQPSWALRNAQTQLYQQREREGIQYRPSIPLPSFTLPQPTEVDLLATGKDAIQRSAPQKQERKITQHGELAMAALRDGESAHYQLWLVLRFLDEAGRGYVSWEKVVATVATKSSPHFLYNPERLRQLRREGDGRYWVFQSGRFWYAKTARLSRHLDVGRLSGSFAYLTEKHLFTTSIAKFRAYCFAAWLANHDNPLSRDTIEKLTGIKERTQRRYCGLAGVDTQPNIAIGRPVTQYDPQDAYWDHQGQGVFEFTDFQGQQGPAQRRYWAWHLPNRYHTPLEMTGKRRCRRHNHDLLITQPAGNVECQRPRRIFFDNGGAAAKAFLRTQDVVYWQRTEAKTGRGLWHEIA